MVEAKNTLQEIKEIIERNQGRRVHLEAHKSKKKLYHKYGYIENIYPSIFTITIEMTGNQTRIQRMSFSYIDLLTNNVKIDLMDPNGEDSTPLYH